jgi:hypothetical protein
VILSAKVVRKPRKPRYCGRCSSRINGVSIVLYGAVDTGDKPGVLYFHPDCVWDSGDKCMLARVVVTKLESNPGLTVAAATALAKKELGYS